MEIDESAINGWGYDDSEEGREHPETAAWSYVDRLFYRCAKCRHEWQRVSGVRPYQPKGKPQRSQSIQAVALGAPSSLADESAIRSLLDEPGVHVIYGVDGRPLYVGMSTQTRSRIRMHLTGDREGSILHEKVGRLLDRELGRSATRDEIRTWLEQCTFAVAYTDDIKGAKAALIHELDPPLNEVVP